MTEYMHLVGAEDVQRASHAMKDAASEMQRAASNIEDSLFRHRQSMDEWLVRFDAAMNSVQAGHIERVRAEAALEEAKWWHDYVYAIEPHTDGDSFGCCDRIAQLSQQAGKK